MSDSRILEAGIPVRVYAEHSALTKRIRELERQRKIVLVHFPYDPESRSRYLRHRAMPSAAQWRDLNMPISEVPGTWGDYNGSEHLAEIEALLGKSNRRDALHVDSAFKSACAGFLTCDGDILEKREDLKRLLGIRFFHPDRDAEIFEQFVDDALRNNLESGKGTG